MILPLCNVDHISCVYVVPSSLMTFISKHMAPPGGLVRPMLPHPISTLPPHLDLLACGTEESEKQSISVAGGGGGVQSR